MNNSFNINTPLLNMQKNKFSKLFGDKQFIKLLFKLFIPAALQSLISIVVLYVDNFALAGLIPNAVEATAAKQALGIANPLLNFQILITIGWLGGVGIMMSQYYGSNNTKLTKQTTAFRIWTNFLLQIPFIILCTTIPKQLITFTAQINSGIEFELANIYLFYSAFTFIPFSLAYSLSFALQETKRPLVSFIASLIGMCTNILLDPLAIIFSNNVQDAVMWVALSTGLARIVQSLIIIGYILFKKDKYIDFFKHWKIKWKNVKKILNNGYSTFINEFVYSTAQLALMICLLSFNPLIHDATTNVILIIQFTSVLWPGIGAASSILIGSELGKGNKEQAKINANRLMFWGFAIASFLCLILIAVSFFINPLLSPAASEETIQTSMRLEWIMAPIIATQGVFSIAYYSIRSGGSKIVLVIDCVTTTIWSTLMIIITFLGVTRNWAPELYIFVLEFSQIIKMIVSLFIYKYYNWARVLTKEEIKSIDKDPDEITKSYVAIL